MSNQSGPLLSKVREIQCTIQELEANLQISRSNERNAHLCFHMDNLKSNTINIQLNDAIQDNKYLLNVLQNKCSDIDLNRNISNSQISTVSMVHLQFKYEELLANHNGLLKMLENKLSEIHTLTEEKKKLQEEKEIYRFKLEESSEKIEELNSQLTSHQLHHKKKLDRLNMEKETLKSVHNQLTFLLHEECMKKNDILSNEIKESQVPERAQLLKEVQKNNLLIFENVRLRQENEYFKALLKLTGNSKRKKIKGKMMVMNG
ncbi:hypothetical protein HHI36_012972 [Cryptolaemus montrouzieri]|uniref:Uncharacterized protein n=1 Tax=Cryptolaemus montrouzieri TaxID=559131 RepID=A0ABD2NH51_9CUCU